VLLHDRAVNYTLNVLHLGANSSIEFSHETIFTAARMVLLEEWNLLIEP